jgi:hypothetical protein
LLEREEHRTLDSQVHTTSPDARHTRPCTFNALRLACLLATGPVGMCDVISAVTEFMVSSLLVTGPVGMCGGISAVTEFMVSSLLATGRTCWGVHARA